jgi:hypothetical protein
MDERDRVRQLLGREPQGAYEVVVRDQHGDPVVLRNAPLLDDGTPMPTRYYLVGADLVREVSRLEAAGGVRRAEAEVDGDELARAHRTYAAERDADIPGDWEGPRPSGGVGGTRTGVKCLHAHLANELAGGDDAVGAWTLRQLAQREPDVVARFRPARDEPTPDTPSMDRAEPVRDGIVVGVGPTCTTVDVDGRHHELPIGTTRLVTCELAGADPPTPEMLANALGLVTDHFDDVVRAEPALLDGRACCFAGERCRMLARVEVGSAAVPADYRLQRDDAEDVFRLLVSEPTAERAQNPGLDDDAALEVVATCCIVLAVMRRLRIDDAAIDNAAARVGTA